MNNDLAKKWIILGVTALALSGIASIALVAGKITNFMTGDNEKYFYVSLIIHVNLGVLVWLNSIIIFMLGRFSKHLFRLGALATFLIAISWFAHTDQTYTNNYVPMFENIIFKIGIYLFIVVMAIQAILGVINFSKAKRYIAFLTILASFVLITAAIALPTQVTSHAFYESLFWGYGHILQFTYTFAMLMAWLLIGQKLNYQVFSNTNLIANIFKYNFLAILISTFAILIFTSIDEANYSTFFTKQMIFLGGLAAIPIGYIVVREIFKNKFSSNNKTLLTGLIFSIILFLYGGVLGGLTAKQLFIDGMITTLTPAHYHSSIFGITVAFMALTYMYFNVNSKWSLIQIYLYSIGQIIYFTGLAVLGGHGGARKTVGIDVEVSQQVKQAMDGGGALALIGGFMFVVIVFRNLKNSNG